MAMLPPAPSGARCRTLVTAAVLAIGFGASIRASAEPGYSKQVEDLLAAMTIEEKVGQLTLLSSDHATTGPYATAGLSNAILRGEVGWCQLFSEPGAGSDLAGVRLRATRCEGGWRLAGQKLWTSGAHHSSHGIVLARSDAEAAKHRGLTMFFVDMASPGITVRPIRQL